MNVSLSEEDRNSEYLKVAIEQVQQELPLLLGPDYLTFSIVLKRLLSEGCDDDLIELFASQPIVYNRLLQYVNRLTAGHGLYGDSITKSSGTRYFCPVGQHFVDAADVQKRDAAGRPICPSHGGVMKIK